jgi:hypothetical protein
MSHQIGDTIMQRVRTGAHRYTLARTFDHVNRFGMPSAVLVWRGTCATCGCQFEVTSSRAAGSAEHRVWIDFIGAKKEPVWIPHRSCKSCRQ